MMSQKLIYRLNILFLALWFGGFTFYAAVVVPIGGGMIGEAAQGFITQKVTFWLNAMGGIALLLLGVHIWQNKSDKRFVILALSLLITWCIQLVLHGLLSQMLDQEAQEVISPAAFYRTHQLYLWVSTFQWLGMIGVLWKMGDRAFRI